MVAQGLQRLNWAPALPFLNNLYRAPLNFLGHARCLIKRGCLVVPFLPKGGHRKEKDPEDNQQVTLINKLFIRITSETIREDVNPPGFLAQASCVRTGPPTKGKGG